MLSDEERMAIEHLKNYPINWLIENVNESAIKIILNLIEKQSKEIEELKEDSCCMTNCVRRDKEKLFLEDKIKAKIEEYENKIKKIRNKRLINEPEDTIIITRYTHYISVLQSLLEKE